MRVGDAGDPDARCDDAIAVLALDALSSADARPLVAALRDRAARHVLLLVDTARTPLDEAELRALGFRRHARDGTLALYGYDVRDYKDRPDWLDARHWAHPELWDKFRW